jgi:hypothetical protein
LFRAVGLNWETNYMKKKMGLYRGSWYSPIMEASTDVYLQLLLYNALLKNQHTIHTIII